jgi:hypothetical protein
LSILVLSKKWEAFMMTSGDVVESAVIKGFSLDLKAFFEGVD